MKEKAAQAFHARSQKQRNLQFIIYGNGEIYCILTLLWICDRVCFCAIGRFITGLCEAIFHFLCKFALFATSKGCVGIVQYQLFFLTLWGFFSYMYGADLMFDISCTFPTMCSLPKWFEIVSTHRCAKLNLFSSECLVTWCRARRLLLLHMCRRDAIVFYGHHCHISGSLVLPKFRDTNQFSFSLPSVAVRIFPYTGIRAVVILVRLLMVLLAATARHFFFWFVFETTVHSHKFC